MHDHDYHQLYWYKAVCIEVYDGDTITVDIDLGCKIWIRMEKIRLYGINTPEIRGEERDSGLVSRDYLRDRILGKKVMIKTHRDKGGKYGRLLADVFIDNTHINMELVDKGLAENKDY